MAKQSVYSSSNLHLGMISLRSLSIFQPPALSPCFYTLSDTSYQENAFEAKRRGRSSSSTLQKFFLNIWSLCFWISDELTKQKILLFVTIILLDLTFSLLALPSTNSFMPFAPGVFNTNINNNVARNETALH